MSKVYLAVLLAVLFYVGSATFDITQNTQSGTAFNKVVCNAQTNLDFKFNSGSSADYTPATPTTVLNNLFRAI